MAFNTIRHTHRIYIRIAIILALAISDNCQLKTDSQRLSTLSLLSVCATNAFPTSRQHLLPLHSLNLVNADLTKELQNVLPNGNLFPLDIRYHIYRYSY